MPKATKVSDCCSLPNYTIFVGVLILIAILLVALYLYCQYSSTPIGIDTSIGGQESPAEPFKLQQKGNTKEQFGNFGFNFKGECRGRTDLDDMMAHQYSFDEVPYFRKFPFFNYYNNPQIIGCGGRRQPCDTRHAIPNILDPIDISNRNIAPLTVRVDQNLDMKLQKIGTIYKIFGNDNQIFPLYGRKVYYNDEKWEYFAGMGPTGEFLRVFQQRQWEELGNNDEVEIEGRCGKYRVSIYDRYMPQYTPFI